MRERYYAGGVLFISRREILFLVIFIFCRISLSVNILGSLKHRQIDLLTMIAYLSNEFSININ